MKFYDDLSQATYGVSYKLQSSEWNIDLYLGWNAAFGQILKNGKSNDTAEIVHTAEYFNDKSEGDWWDSLFGIYTSDEEDHLIKPPRVTHVYWSASQLLSKLDTRPTLTPTYLGVYPRPLEIPDEFCVTVSDLHLQHSETFIKDYHLLDNQKPTDKTNSKDDRKYFNYRKLPHPVLPNHIVHLALSFEISLSIRFIQDF